MPYCVRCGVRLENTAESCPLCSTPVPEEFICAEHEAVSRDLAVTREVRVPSRYVAGISTLVLLIPLGITLIIDVSITGMVTWSYYAMISILLFWVLLVQPFILKTYRVVRSITNNFFAIALFLYLIDIKNPPAAWAGYPAASLVFISFVLLIFQYVSRGYYRIILTACALQFYLMVLELLSRSALTFLWSAQIALPLVVCIALGSILTLFFTHRVSEYASWSSGFLVLSLVLFFTGFIAGVIELTLRYSITDIPLTGWSLYVLIPMLVLSALSYYAAKTAKVHQPLKRRFHL